jgi:hypothetical protein
MHYFSLISPFDTAPLGGEFNSVRLDISYLKQLLL